MLRRFGKAAYDFGISVPIVGRLLLYRRRTLFVLMVVAGVLVGLIGKGVYRELRQQQAIEEVSQQGGVVHRSYRMDTVSSVARRVVRFTGGYQLLPLRLHPAATSKT